MIQIAPQMRILVALEPTDFSQDTVTLKARAGKMKLVVGYR